MIILDFLLRMTLVQLIVRTCIIGLLVWWAIGNWGDSANRVPDIDFTLIESKRADSRDSMITFVNTINGTLDEYQRAASTRRHLDVGELKETVTTLRTQSQRVLDGNKSLNKSLMSLIAALRRAESSLQDSATKHREYADNEKYTSIQEDYRRSADVLEALSFEMIRHAQKCDKLLRLLKEHVEFLESTTTFFERFEDALSPIPDGSANLDIEAFLDEVSAFIKAYEKLRTDVLEHKQQLDTPFTTDVPVTPVVYSSKATPTPPQIAATYSSRNGTDQRPEWVKMFRDVGEVIIDVCFAVMVFFFVVVGSLCGLIIVANKIWPEQLERLFPAEDEKSS